MMKSKYYDAVAAKYNLSKDRVNIILIGTPNHGNLGDHAIAYATLKILKELFLDANISEMTIQDFAIDIEALYFLLKQKDIIILQGGGNCGNFYMDDEMIRRYVALRFRKNKIILFPQSVCFSDDEAGKQERDISSRIYGCNKNLYLIARDTESEKEFKSCFHNMVYKLPDVVLTLPQMNMTKEKAGALLCLRNDEEGILENSQQTQLESLLREKYPTVKRMDTVVSYAKEDFCREEEIKALLREIGSAELMVTDRLHGMVFSVITGTECIVLPTFNTKVVSAFEEIKDVSNLTLARTAEEFQNALNGVGGKKVRYQNDHITEGYKKIINEIMVREVYYPETHITIEENIIFEITGYWSAQHYETNYWRETIKNEYKKLEDSSREKAGEVLVYKDWIANMEKQLGQIKADNQRMQSDREKETDSYKEWIANLKNELEQTKAGSQNALEEKEKEAADYKEWVANLEKQLEQTKADSQNALEEKEKEAADYKEWVANLEKQIKELKVQYQNVLGSVAERDKELLTYKERTDCLQKDIEQMEEDVAISKKELMERERQWNIQQRELFNCIKAERGKKEQP